MVEVQDVTAISIDKVRNARDQPFPIVTGNQQLRRLSHEFLASFRSLFLSSQPGLKISTTREDMRIHGLAGSLCISGPNGLKDYFDVLELKSLPAAEFCGESGGRDSFESRLEDIRGSC